MLEIELKFSITNADAMRQAFGDLGARTLGQSRQSDTYFRHPVRNFAETDEAFRLRTVDDQNYLTYKGPVLDKSVKIRHEIEIETASGAEDRGRLHEMLAALGFDPVRVVSKVRTSYSLERDGRHFELTLDVVEGLGDFVEIETLAEPEHKDAAKSAVLALAEELHLEEPINASYLAMLLACDEAES